jgi:uncharacterized protein YqeY
MTITKKLRAESLRLRKERNPVAASITFVISEIERVGKNAGNRETTNDEAIKVVQKLVSTLRDNLNYQLTETDAAATQLQVQILESVLPQMLTEQETVNSIRVIMTGKTQDNIPAKGDIMKLLRAQHGALIDLKLAGTIMKEVYGL